MQPNEIHALIQLLDDPDEGVYQHVREQLMSRGIEALPALLESRESHAYCDEHERRMDELVDGLHGQYVHNGLRDWFDSGAERVFEGALWVHKAANPLLDMEALRQDYDKLKRNVWLELNEEFTALEQVRILNHIVYDHEEYTNAKTGKPDPKHALLGEVMAEKRGNPLGLGILYLSLAQDLNLPIHGVNLPNHFILCYCDEHHVHHEMSAPDNKTSGGVLIYINPFSHGTIIKKAEVRRAPASSCMPPCLGHARAELRWRTRKRAHAPGAAGRQFAFDHARHRAPAPGRWCMHSPMPSSHHVRLHLPLTPPVSCR